MSLLFFIFKLCWCLFEVIYIYFCKLFIYQFLPDLAPTICIPKLTLTTSTDIKLIEEASIFLNLPQWSRNYHHCYSSKSEINCAQLIKAYQTIKNWSINNLTRSSSGVVHIQPNNGIGNSLYTITAGITLAIFLNLTAHIQEPIGGIDYHPSIKTEGDFHCNQFPHFNVQNQENLNRDFTNSHIKVSYCFPFFLLVDPKISLFIYKHFGLHFVYYISNFATSINFNIRCSVIKMMESIPRSLKLIGVHIRSHKYKSDMFITKESKVKNLVIPFLNRLLDQKNYLAVATDWTVYENLFKSLYKKNLIMADLQRRPDGKKFDAAVDIEILMSCNKLIGTYRSSFSAIAGMRAMHRVYYVAMENPSIFQFVNSQNGITSGIYEAFSDYTYYVNQNIRLSYNNENAVRIFFKYTVL